MSVRLLMVVILLLCASAFSGAAAEARDWFIAPTGNDATGEGTIAKPFATLSGAFMYNSDGVIKQRAQPGDTIQCRAGTYTAYMGVNGDCCTPHLPNTALLGGAPGAPITIRAYDGDFTAHFTGSVRLNRVKYLIVTGLDFSGLNPDTAKDVHPLFVSGGSGDWYTPDKRSNHILITNCKIHDCSAHGGEFKVQDTDYVTTQKCEIYNLGGAYAFGANWVQYYTIRQNYVHDWFAAVSCFKGGDIYCTLDGNVVTPPSVPASGVGKYCWGFLLGDGTGTQFCNPDFVAVPYECMYSVIRNNILDSARRGAVTFRNAGYSYIYNNLFKDANDYAMGDTYSYFTVLYALDFAYDNTSRHMYVFNNVLYDTSGKMRPYGSALSGGGAGAYEDWQTGNNNFYNNGKPLRYEADTPNPTKEPGATYGDPHLTLAGSPKTWQGWVNYYRPKWDAQSNAMLKDKGNSNAGNLPLPAVLKDIEGKPRPRDRGWDIGPYEYQGAAVIPVASFSADRQGIHWGAQQWGLPPATFEFTDLSSGGPTAWSWSFGDGGTSTAQNPTHTYKACKQYTVALTATNSAGKKTCTRKNYITLTPLKVDFTASPTWGAAPLAVTFADASTNSPTAWSWSFGDGGQSTAQGPSHTYEKAGYYTVTLTAKNASGSDTATQSNAITVCTEAFVYPETYKMSDPTTFASGDLKSLAASDSNYLVFSRAAGGNDFQTQYFATAGFTQSQVQAIKYEVQVHASAPDAVSIYVAPENVTDKAADAFCFDNTDGNTPVGTSDQWLSATRVNVPAFMSTSGALGVGLCGCRSKGAAVDLSYNVVRFHLYLKPTVGPKPPVAK